MAVDTQSLLWLLPVSFMIHDFEEIVSWEAWMTKNGGEITARAPAFVSKLANQFVKKSTAQVAFVVFLIFCLTATSVFLATSAEYYPMFLMLMSMFFLHGFGHFAQALLLRRYVPGLITSGLVVIPYGVIAGSRVISEKIVSVPGLFSFFALGIVLMFPFILLMHKIGDYLYPRVLKLLGL